VKHIVTLINKVVQKANNVSIKKKMLTMYAVCVLFPIVFINSLFFITITNKVREEEYVALEQSMDRIKTRIINDLEQAMSVYRIINTDRKLSSMLNTRYEDELDYYIKYQEYMAQAVEKYITVFKPIQSINIYTHNDTIITSRNYFFLDDSVKSSAWYHSFVNGESGSRIFAHINNKQDGLPRDNRYLSIVQYLDNFRTLEQENNIIKVDIQIMAFSQIVQSERADGYIYLLDNNNKVIYSNNPEVFNDTNKFIDFREDYYYSDDIVLIRSFGDKSYLEGWHIVGEFPKNIIAASIRRAGNRIFFVGLGSLIVTSFVILIISNSMKSRLELVSEHLVGISSQDFKTIQTYTGEDEIGRLIKEYNNSTIKIKNLIKEVYEAEIERTKAELKALQSQINPHFLFNTLNAVRSRCILKGEAETAQIIKHIAKNFRRIIDWGDDLVPIKEEMEFIKDFLEIQKYRYGDKLDFHIQVDEELLNYKIPKMCIQPLVENSSIHGIELKDEPGMVNIYLTITEDKFHCSIVDNGKGITEGRLKYIKKKLSENMDIDGSIGVGNVYKRLKLYFGELVDFEIVSEIDKGTRVSFVIPLTELSKS
jgi:two-component system, sensor histidine kinase YesM